MSHKQRIFAYVDGFNLYHGIKHAARSGGWGKQFYWLDIPSLVRNRLHNGQDLIRLRYYTAIRPLPRKITLSEIEKSERQASLSRQKIYLAALRAQQSVDVIGHQFVEKNPWVCRECSFVQSRFEEKQTDVHIGVDLVADAALNRYDRAWLISADTDLVPAIQRVHSDWPEKEVCVLFPPGQHQADALADAAHRTSRIKKKHLEQNQLAQRIKTSSGGLAERPQDWQMKPSHP